MASPRALALGQVAALGQVTASGWETASGWVTASREAAGSMAAGSVAAGSVAAGSVAAACLDAAFAPRCYCWQLSSREHRLEVRRPTQSRSLLVGAGAVAASSSPSRLATSPSSGEAPAWPHRHPVQLTRRARIGTVRPTDNSLGQRTCRPATYSWRSPVCGAQDCADRVASKTGLGVKINEELYE